MCIPLIWTPKIQNKISSMKLFYFLVIYLDSLQMMWGITYSKSKTPQQRKVSWSANSIVVNNQNGNITWNVERITKTFGYILHKSCWPSFVWICCTIKSIATILSAPRGMMISAYFFDGSINSSKLGFTNRAYCNSQKNDWCGQLQVKVLQTQCHE